MVYLDMEGGSKGESRRLRQGKKNSVRHQLLLSRITKLVLEYGRIPHGSLPSDHCERLRRSSSVEANVSQ